MRHFCINIISIVQNHGFYGLWPLGRTKFILAVVTQHKMLKMQDKCGLKARFFKMRRDVLKAHMDVAKQAPFIGIIVGKATCELPNLADVMENGARSEDLAVKLWVVVRELLAQLRHRQHMLHKAAHKGMVHGLCRGTK